jgi:DNA-binding CsgD family transcriptional regulator
MQVQFHRHKAAVWLAQSLEDGADGFDAARALQQAARAAGARHAAIVMQHVPGVVEENSLAVDTYGPAWAQFAKDCRFETIDPTRHAATIASPLVDWADLPRRRVKERRYFRDFREHDLGVHGLTALHRGQQGDRSLLTFNSDVTPKRWLSLREDIAEAVAIIHPALHRFVLRTTFGITGVDVIRLTPRERECLGWAAHGRTSKEISDVLGLTPATVNFFIDGAVQKLAAQNRAHAAAKAVSLGLISPPR